MFVLGDLFRENFLILRVIVYRVESFIRGFFGLRLVVCLFVRYLFRLFYSLGGRFFIRVGVEFFWLVLWLVLGLECGGIWFEEKFSFVSFFSGIVFYFLKI